MLFVDDYQKVDREALRQYIQKELAELLVKVEALLHGPEYAAFWTGLHDAIALIDDTKELSACRDVENEIKSLDAFIKEWMQTAVDSEQRMDFFVRTKAAEIASGDQFSDYYWAMRIRHDQLVALIRVLTILVDHIEDWVQQKPQEVIDQPIFQGMTEHTVEEQVFLEAEQVHREREKLEKKSH